MRKNKFLTIFTVCILFTIPIVKFSVAQPSTYVGVEEGDEYTWKMNFDINGVDQLVNNIRQVLVNQTDNISTIDLYGFESLNISESIEYAINTALNKTLPSGWESKNISSLIKEIFPLSVGLFNLNFSAFIDFVINGLNIIMPSGWKNFTLQELAYYALPPGWENKTLLDIIQGFLPIFIPEGFSINFLSVDLLLSLFIPENNLQYSIADLFALLSPEIINLNISTAIDTLTLHLDNIMPVGWDSLNFTSFIEDLVGQSLINISGSEVASTNISTLIGLLIHDLVEPNILYILNNSLGLLPLGWETLTISELIQLYMNNLILMYDNTIATKWNSLRSLIKNTGFISNEIGLKARVENIGTEEFLSLSGLRGVPINLTLSISLNMINWIPFSTILNSFGINLSFFTAIPMLVDRSTYPNNLIALIDQMPFTGGLIIANNSSFELNSQDIIIPVAEDPNGIVISAEWTDIGLLKSATIETSGITAFSIELEIGKPESLEDIPGYEISFILGTTFFMIIGVIIIVKKKKIRS